MTAARPNMFWIGALAAIALMVVLLRDILLPFVAGIALAYLLDPVVERIERLGEIRIACRPKCLATLWTSCRRPPDPRRAPCEPVSICNRTSLSHD
jgi:predicted PurR-regulated permease PerM